MLISYSKRLQRALSLKWIALLLAALIGLAQPLQAQSSEEEVQRCVWSCLYGPGGNDPNSPAYDQCVNTNCLPMMEGGDSQAPADPTAAWQTGRGGQGTFAGVDLRGAGSAMGVYLFCATGGNLRLSVVGMDGPSTDLIFRIDGQDFRRAYRLGERNWPEFTLAPTDPLIAGLRVGSRLTLLLAGTDFARDASLSGSGRALSTLISGC